MFTTLFSQASGVRARAIRVLTLSLLAGVLVSAQTPQFVVGYYQESSAFPVSQLATNGSLAHLTHLNYAFAKIVQTDTGTKDANQNEIYSYACAPFDPAGETGTNGVFQQLKALKQSNTSLKVLISVGGEMGSGFFSDAASDDTHRQHFVQSCINQFINGQFASPSVPGVFDGIDIDWEFPLAANDASNYNALLKEFRAQLDAHAGARLLLTSAISPRNGPNTLQNIQFSGSTGAASYVDFFNVMTYDYAGSWNDSASSTAPLPSIRSNISDLMSVWNVPANKMVLGIPFYGVHYSGNFNNDTAGTSLSTLLSHASKAPVLTPPDQYGNQGTQPTDYSTLIANNLTVASANVGLSHDTDSSAWSFDGVSKLLWSFDDETTIAAKAAYARTMGLAGIMTWDISKDSANGTLLCAMEQGAAGSTTPVCGSSTGNQPAPGTVIFDFESDQQGWDRTGNVFSIYTSTDKANTGAQSLSAHFITYRQSYQPHGTVFVTPPTQVQPGSMVEFHVWVPQSALTNVNGVSNLTGMFPFTMDANWTWTGNATNLSTMTGDAWNTLTIQIPANAVMPLHQIGIQFDSSRLWDGIVYIDTVKVR